MKASEIRTEARNSLKGQWGKIILYFIVYFIVSFVLSFFLGFIPLIGSIASFLISIPLTVGFISTILKITRREDFGYFDFINVAIELFGKSWGIVGNTILKMWKPFALMGLSIILIIVSSTLIFSANILSTDPEATAFIVPALLGLLASLFMFISSIWIFVRGLLYSLSNLILIDNPNMNTKDIVEKSEALMKGNRLKLIFLQLSFIGWAILATLSLGIGYIWLAPYMAVAETIFYIKLAENTENQ